MPKEQEDGRSTAVTRRRDAAISEYGEDAVYGLVAEGRTTGEIADALGLDGDNQRTRWAVRQWLRRDKARFEDARKASVDALAERALDIYGDEAPETNADGTWRDRKAGHLRWIAELRAGIGRGGTGVNITIEELHLDALRQAGHMERSEEGREILDAEYTEIED